MARRAYGFGMIAIAAATIAAGGVQATTILQTDAVLVRGDATLSSVTIGGRVMVGGNASFNGGTNIGGNLGAGANGTTVVGVGGNINYVNSTVSRGNVVYGGTNQADQWNVVSVPGGTIAHGSVGTGIANAFAEASALSTYLAGQTATGTLSSLWGVGTLAGSSSGLNIYNVTTADLASLYQLNISGGGSAIVNVTGGSYSTYLNFSTSLSASNILFNFVDATSVNFSGSNLPGSILAPNATVNASGTTQGSIIASVLTGGGSTILGNGYGGSVAGFSYTPPVTGAVPEPGTWVLLIAGFGLVGASLRRNPSLNRLWL